MEPVTAAGGVIFRQNNGELEVVLIYRRGVWDLPKGKLDEGESIEECAIREIAEETGLSDPPEIVAKLVNTYHEYEQDSVDYGKTTHWYAMQLPDPASVKFIPETREGVEKVDWRVLPEAKKLVGFQNLVVVLDSLDAWYNDE